MGTFKGTKGEWLCNVNGKNIYNEKGVVIIEGVVNDRAENYANMKLSAAAPELLESLKDLIEWANIKDGSPSQYLRDRALSAIKKATE